jgi:formylglycine-generating enzyme required for sulfatase activity
MKRVKITMCLVVFCMMAVVNVASADTIRGINMDFVSIGHAGNASDTTIETNNGTFRYGSVGYNYRIGKYEVTNAQWNAFTSVAGVPTGDPSNAFAFDQGSYFTGAQQPTNCVSWFEAAQFCNYLTSGNKMLGAYNFGIAISNGLIDRASAISTYGIVYVLPTENEWYKAAYYKPDGSGYSVYANGQNTYPVADYGWNYYGGSYTTPWNVGTGTQEQNGTYDMMGNVWEWNESVVCGNYLGLLGGSYDGRNGDYFPWLSIASSSVGGNTPTNDDADLGFRVVAVPEPCSLVLLSLGGLALLRKKP